MSSHESKDAGGGYYTHPTSVVDDGAEIGQGTKIWHFCHVFSGARIGERCVIGQGCSIASSVRIGNQVKIQNGVSVYDGVTLEDGVFCGPHMIFTNVINPRALIERKSEFMPTVVGAGATIGAGAIIVCGNKIGKYALVGAGAVITKDVLPYSLVIGNPGRRMGWVSKGGIRLEFDESGNACDETGARYKLQDGSVKAVDDL